MLPRSLWAAATARPHTPQPRVRAKPATAPAINPSVATCSAFPSAYRGSRHDARVVLAGPSSGYGTRACGTLLPHRTASAELPGLPPAVEDAASGEIVVTARLSGAPVWEASDGAGTVLLVGEI